MLLMCSLFRRVIMAACGRRLSRTLRGSEDLALGRGIGGPNSLWCAQFSIALRHREKEHCLLVGVNFLRPT